MNQEKIQINGLFFNKSNIEELKKNNSKNKWWENEIFQFLKDWFNESEFVVTLTSGSTGIPKEIQLSKNAMRYSARMTNAFFNLNSSKTALLCLPASYIAGKMMIVRAIEAGFNLLTTEPKANPFENIEKKINFAAITPYQLFYSVESLKLANFDDIIVGGGHVNSKLENAIQDFSCQFYETYGMTETCSHIAIRCLNGKNKTDFFKLLEGISIRKDERGCLVINAPKLLNKEIQTNDIVEILDEKYFKWLGRTDLVINSGGIKIHPEQLEKKIENLIPYNFLIASIADEITENKIVLIIEGSDNSILSNLKTKLKIVLQKYEIPKEIYFVPHFVYSSGNKFLRKETLKLVLKDML